MGLLELLSGLEDHKRVTLLANEYVILEHKQEQCVGRYKVFDFNGVELIIKATLDTPQEVMSVDTLGQKLQNLKIDNSPNTCSTIGCSGTVASGSYATALGIETKASGDYSIALGAGTCASGNYGVAMGMHTIASGHDSTTMGFVTTAKGDAAVAMGGKTYANGKQSIATGIMLQVDMCNTLGNGGPIYGEELYSKQLASTGSELSGSTFLNDISNLHIYSAVPPTTYRVSPVDIDKFILDGKGPVIEEINLPSTTINYTISGENMRYFNRSLTTTPSFQDTPAVQNTGVNHTQLLYTLVGAVKELQKEVNELKST